MENLSGQNLKNLSEKVGDTLEGYYLEQQQQKENHQEDCEGRNLVHSREIKKFKVTFRTGA